MDQEKLKGFKELLLLLLVTGYKRRNSGMSLGKKSARVYLSFSFEFNSITGAINNVPVSGCLAYFF